MRRPPLATAAVALVVALAGCGSAGTGGEPGAAPLRVEVLERLPHDPDLFTQGLEVAGDELYEGTGRPGESRVRASSLDDGRVLREVALPAPLFGEGITVVDDTVWQLTWQDGIAVERDRATLAERRTVPYEGEGWGLCSDGDRLVMSDGSPRLSFRDPTTFEVIGGVDVRRDGEPVEELNELECVDGAVWANVWRTDEIVRIDPATGAVTGVVDAAGLLPQPDAAGADVLNGIAALPGTDEFLVTGKWWPALFRVRFVEA